MRRAGIAVVALLLAGLVAWFLRPTGDVPRAGTTESGDPGVDEALPASGVPDAAAVPGLTGRSERASGPSATTQGVRGRGTIAGVVRRDGAATPAVVELHPVDPLYDRSFTPGSTARVLARSLSPPPRAVPAATARAGADGRYAFEGWGRGPYVVRARTEDGAKGFVDVRIDVEGARVLADVSVVAARETLRGRATTADGLPWRGTVVVRAADGGLGIFFGRLMPVESAETDEAGRFSVAGLPRGKVALSALVPATLLVTPKPVSLPHEGEVTLVVDGFAAQATGRVVADADGSPIAGADVAFGAANAGGVAVVARSVTAADGAFRFPLPEGARAGLVVAARGYATHLRFAETWVEAIEIRLQRSARLEGQVTSKADGRPVEGAVVKVTPESRSGLGSYGGEGRTLADGRYAIEDLAPGTARVSASAPGFVGEPAVSDGGADPTRATLVAGGTVSHDVRLVRAARATGRVLDVGGAPVGGAVVTAERSRTSPDVDDEWVEEVREGTRIDPVASAADGTFVVDGLRPGSSYRFQATAPEAMPGSAGPFDVGADAPIVVELRLGAVRHVEVTVLDDASGGPIEGATIEAKSEGDKPDPSGIWKTSAAGRADVGPVPAGEVRLVASSDEHLPSAPTPAPASASSVTIRLRRGLALAGRVTRPDGTPAAGASVGATIRSSEAWAYRTAVAGEDGGFRLDGLPEGDVEVTAAATVAGRTAAAKGTFAAGAWNAVLALGFVDEAGPGRVVVRVLDPQGKPVPSATVRFESSRSSEQRDAADGMCVFEPSLSGSGTVDVREARGLDGGLLPLGGVRVDGVVPGGPVVVVRLPPERTISGRVRDESGQGVAGAAVRVNPPGRERWGFERATAVRTADDGTFLVRGLGEGEHAVDVVPPPPYVKPDPIRALAGSSDVDVTLLRGLAARITVLDSEGKPVRGAEVRPTGQREEKDVVTGVEFPKATTDAAGVAQLGGLPRGEALHLSIRPPRGRSDLLAAALDEWTPRDEVVRLGRAFTLRGRVVDGAGNALRRALVVRVGNDGRYGTRTDDDGRFVMTGIPYEEVVLQVSMGWGPGEPGKEFRVAAGTADTVLTVDAGLTLTVRLPSLPGAARVTLLTEADGKRGRVEERESGGGQAVVFAGLRAGATYAVWVHCPEGKSHALRTGVRGGDDVRVTMVPGRTITVRLRPALPAEWGVVMADLGGLQAAGTRVSDEVYEISGLPEGTWVVSAGIYSKKTWFKGTAKAAAGTTIDLELTGKEEEVDEEGG